MTSYHSKQPLSIFLLLQLILFSFCSFGVELKQLSFVNQEGKQIKLNQFGDKYLLLSFIFTRCPVAKMCPLTVTLNKRIEREWKKKGKPFPLQFILATLDPEGDTPKVLKEYGKKNGLNSEHFTFLTGTDENMAELTSFFDSAPIPGQTFISHRPTSVLLNPKLEIVDKFFDNQFSYDSINHKNR